jgi:HSP20 family protein
VNVQQQKQEEHTMAIMRYRTRPASILSDTPELMAGLDPLTNRLARLMDESFALASRSGTNGGSHGMGWVPGVDVEETEEAVILTADLPGFDPDQVEIQVENQILTLSGSRESVREEPARSGEVGEESVHREAASGGTPPEQAASEADAPRRFHLRERRWGSFSRSFTLPRTVRADEITASFDRGVLTVHMPKSAEARSRKIQIRSGT